MKNEPRRTPYPVIGAMVLVALIGRRASAEVACAHTEWTVEYKYSRVVALARVTAESREGDGATFSLSVLRNWKGKSKTLKAHTAGGEDGGRLQVGDYVLVYANGAAFEFDSCSQPESVYEEHVRAEISALDRMSHFPPLSLPPDALRRPRPN